MQARGGQEGLAAFFARLHPSTVVAFGYLSYIVLGWCTTFTALLGVMRGAARGEKEARFWGRPIPADRITLGTALLGSVPEKAQVADADLAV
jgi:hypothetical protein